MRSLWCSAHKCPRQTLLSQNSKTRKATNIRRFKSQQKSIEERRETMGVEKEVLRSGTGPKPVAGRKVTVHCTGYG